MYRHIIDRSNLQEPIAYYPTTKEHTTRLQELEREDCQFPRRDIVLFNGTRSGREYVLEVTISGFAGDTFILDMLEPEAYDQVQDIAYRMRDNARLYHPAMKLLAPDSQTKVIA